MINESPKDCNDHIDSLFDLHAPYYRKEDLLQLQAVIDEHFDRADLVVDDD